MPTTVINMKSAPEGWMSDSKYVYIGRAGAGFDGYFGNPVILRFEEHRATVLQNYLTHLKRRLSFDTIFRARIKELQGKILVCFCHPKLCHGDILALLADIL